MAVSGKHEVVYFFDEQGVDKEMLYSEFESLLDSMVPAPELASKTVEAVYANLDGELNIASLVFFLVNFDSQGNVDSKWNVPLQKLSSWGVEGPDLGGGPCKIYMQGVNERADIQKYLWDPGERAGSNDLIHIRAAVRGNRLCLSKEEGESEWMGDASMVMREAAEYSNAPAVSPPQANPPTATPLDLDVGQAEDPVSSSSLMSDGGDEFSQAIKIIETQRIRIAALENAVRNGKSASGASKEEIEKYTKQIEEQKKINLQLSEQLKTAEAAVAQATKEKEKIEASLKKLEKEAKETLAKTKQKLEKEKEAALKKLQAESEKEKASIEKAVEKDKKDFEQKSNKALDDAKRELEEEYKQKDQQIEALKKELTELRGDKFRLMKGGADDFFQKIAAADISFMSFKPGAGHMTIPLNEIAGFIESPNAFCAKKCNVSLEDYEVWLEHYNKPVCNAPLPGDKICGERVKRIDIPVNYRPKESDRCSKHGGK